VQNIKNAKLFYCIFLNNMYDSLPYVEQKKINFIFTLYPGGGFDTKDEIALNKLKAVLSSKYFKGVIVTQQFTQDFIVNRYNCPENKILNIFGCLVPQNSINSTRLRRFNNSMTLNVCFCAAKYTEIGADKGYDIFIEVAKLLASNGHNIRFNVVGNYDSEVIDIEGFEKFFFFHGLKKYEELSELESQAKNNGFSFVELEGDIAIIGNGAGLVMSTLDMVTDAGGKAGAFLDFGGRATTESIYQALTVISKVDKIRVILVNLFGGIVRTDLVAQAILNAYHDDTIKVPIFARITGAESEKAKALLENSKARLFNTVEEAINAAVKY